MKMQNSLSGIHSLTRTTRLSHASTALWMSVRDIGLIRPINSTTNAPRGTVFSLIVVRTPQFSWSEIYEGALLTDGNSSLNRPPLFWCDLACLRTGKTCKARARPLPTRRPGHEKSHRAARLHSSMTNDFGKVCFWSMIQNIKVVQSHMCEKIHTESWIDKQPRLL